MTRRGVEWLSAAADDPAMCRSVWADDPRRPCMLSAGRIFDVVSVEQRLGLEAFDQLLRRSLPFGPTILDRKASRVGFFLGSGSQEPFTHFLGQEAAEAPAYRYLGSDSVVVVPGPMPMDDDRYQWLRAPSRRPEANPLRVVALATMLVASAELLARADRYSERYGTPYAAVAALPEEAAPDAG